MQDRLGTQQNFRSLSIRDLLEARDQYHYHLMNKANVVGTGIGLYLIRKSDPYPTHRGSPREAMPPKPEERVQPRTFFNSEVRGYSWPCVMVLVNNWEPPSEFGNAAGQISPDLMVPRTLYMADGRRVPVCVVLVKPNEPDRVVLPDWHWPSGLYGSGMPIVVDSQGQERRATAGCLVSDGHTTYALTSLHVCGEKGQVVSTIGGNRVVRIGQSSEKQLSRRLFKDVYEDLPARRTYVNLDVGLVELDDLNRWTTDTYGLGEVGPMADLNQLNITLRLIGAPVVAQGAASGRLEGRVRALFYRYRSVGGYDYVSDFLIAPRVLDERDDGPNPARTQHTHAGDSGAIWHLVVPVERKETQSVDLEQAPRKAPEEDEFSGELRPLAIEWGGQAFAGAGAGERFTFALATSLTTVCREFDVELVTRHNVGVNPFWGRFGHYSIGAFACQALPAGALRDFFVANVDRISFAQLDAKAIQEYLKNAKANGDFVPLADVPDEVWKKYVTNLGGRDDKASGNGRTTGPEHPTHFADADEVDAAGVSLRAHSLDPANLTVAFWQQFYDSIGRHEQHERGLLPFRVWQFYKAMKEFAAQGDALSYLCAAGLLAHYVGDACQPLHGSKFADGFADQPTTEVHHKRVTGEEYTTDSHVGAGVHSAYETDMIDRFSEPLIAGIAAALTPVSAPFPASGADAALEVVRLMESAATRIPPVDLVNAYVTAGGKNVKKVQEDLWQGFRAETIATMVDGARVLASIWAGAWQGSQVAPGDLVPLDFGALAALYNRTDFVPSLDLDHIGPALQ